LLDTRIVGRDPQADEEASLPWDDPARSLLGDEQRSWVHARVKDTTRPWCLLVSGVVLNRMELPVEKGAKLGDLAPSGYAVIGGQAMCTDEWDGYPAERRALTAAIAERGSGVVTLSGDVHSAWAFEGPCGEDGAPVAVEFVAPCITATPMARQLPPGWRKLLGLVAERLPEARWFELEHHGYVVVTVDPAGAQADWHTVDTEDPEARTRLAASWRHPFVRPGRLEEIRTQTATPPTQRRRQRRRIAAAGGLAGFVAFLEVLRRRRRTS
ncbi:MAG TPA: alkaline phosphatase D family protein, partial [Acidimicrobiales bacterium]|nr:alkaline phosphatase D family protein [Acidimicrobiales bacterium]